MLTVAYFLLKLSLFSLELLSEVVDLFFLLVEYFILLLFTTTASAAVLQLFLDLTNVRVISLNHSLHLKQLLLHLLQFNTILFNTVLQPISSLTKG